MLILFASDNLENQGGQSFSDFHKARLCFGCSQ